MDPMDPIVKNPRFTNVFFLGLKFHPLITSTSNRTFKCTCSPGFLDFLDFLQLKGFTPDAGPDSWTPACDCLFKGEPENPAMERNRICTWMSMVLSKSIITPI